MKVNHWFLCCALGLFTVVLVMGCNNGITTPSRSTPTSRFTVTPSSGDTTTLFNVDASTSSDTVDALSALQFRWDWTDTGVWTPYSSTPTASHTYAIAGTYTIRLQVKNTAGLTATVTHKVTVSSVGGNTAPTASFTVTPPSGIISTNFSFNATASSDAQDATAALQVRWDWESNGTWTTYTTAKTASHTFSTVGTHTVSLQVLDTGGLSGTTTRSVMVTAANTAPTASFTVTPPSGIISTNFSFNATASSDAQDATAALQVRWDWESNGTWTTYTTTKTASHTFSTVGNHTVTLQVLDTGGLSGTTTRTVMVNAGAGPILAVALDSSQNGGGSVKLASITTGEMLNTSGTIVSTATIAGGVANFDMTGLTAGTYFLRLNNLTNDLVPTRLDNPTVNTNEYVGNALVNAVIGTLASPTYRIKTFSSGQGNPVVVKYSNGTTALPSRNAYVILSLTVSPKLTETRVIGTGALLASKSGNHHSFPSWMLGSSNHGTGNTASCSDCHGTLTSHPASYGSINESNGWCYKCHNGPNGTGSGFVDPAQ